MSLLASLAASALIAAAAWFGISKRYWFALLAIVAAVLPLLFDAIAVKAIFVWLALIGPIVMLGVMWHGLRAPGR